MAFEHHFSSKYPEDAFDQRYLERYKDMPLLDELIDTATKDISAVEQFKQLPERNQQMVLEMAGFMINKANRIVDTEDCWRENYWGLYIIGSRARNEARPDSDLDLLSVGTFYQDLDFIDAIRPESVDGWYAGLFDDFDVEFPDDWPSEYNVGEVDRKYLQTATPRNPGVLAVDLCVVDLTFVEVSLDEFKTEMDVDENGVSLQRVPLIEVSAPAVHRTFRP